MTGLGTTDLAAASAASDRFPPPRVLPDSLRAAWSALFSGGSAYRFEPAALDALPEPARRWLRHAVPAGTLCHPAVGLELRGRIRLAGWRSFRARQVLAAPHGYLWAERTRLCGLPVSGYDRLTDSAGEMRHTLLGCLPLVHAAGPDLTRSAAGRLAAETVLWPPAALDRAIDWQQDGPDSVTMLVPVAGCAHPVSLTVAQDGRLLRVTTPRWTRLGRGPYRLHEFVVEVRQEIRHAGVLLPAAVVAGYATEPPFISQTVDRLVTPR
ncbi:DUF6544 family protein [Kitasatospora sp. NPDC097643]|uniref:DUF6544 family protein n=1 Tax=Kitasatospora sp. NPDC097643 TaxID=3157230 RepID=UPI00332F7A7D